MNNQRLLTGLLSAALLSIGVCASGQESSVITLEQLFETAERNSVQLRPSFSAEEEASREIGAACAGLLPDISAGRNFFISPANLPLLFYGTGYRLW